MTGTASVLEPEEIRQAQIRIDVVSDTICPWCFIGKRRLEKALAELPNVKASVHWRPFLLDRTIPEGGMDRETYLTRKFGADGTKHIHDRIRAAGAGEGIAFAFEKIKKTPNTIDSHRLLHWADAEGKQDAVAERLFRLYFLEGADIGSRKVLAGAASDAGMDGDAVMSRLNTDEAHSLILREVQEANAFGIDGVPCFIFDRRTFLPGAQSSEVLTEAIRRVLATTD
jgi:predicted DsbA family dithiol-disulfide isomerase